MMGRVIAVTLTEPEIAIAFMVAGQREGMNFHNGAQQNYGNDGTDWGKPVIGCMGEMALAKYKDRYWSGNVGNYDAADVGRNMEVRATTLTSGNLLLHDEDKDHHFYFLAIIAQHTVYLHGYIKGAVGKDKGKYWDATLPYPAYRVPRLHLTPMEPETEEPEAE